MHTLLRILAVGALLFSRNASAQGISIIQGSDGTSGTVVDLGGGFRSYSDSRGNTGTIMDLGGGFQTYQFSSPRGGLQSGTILTLPPPGSNVNSPPAGLAPTPVLPFFPKSPPAPREQIAPVVPLTPNQGPFSTFGGSSGRFGR
jgi:hypothetical protein